MSEPFQLRVGTGKAEPPREKSDVPSSIPEAGSWSNLILEARTGSESLAAPLTSPVSLASCLPGWA